MFKLINYMILFILIILNNISCNKLNNRVSDITSLTQKCIDFIPNNLDSALTQINSAIELNESYIANINYDKLVLFDNLLCDSFTKKGIKINCNDPSKSLLKYKENIILFNNRGELNTKIMEILTNLSDEEVLEVENDTYQTTFSEYDIFNEMMASELLKNKELLNLDLIKSQRKANNIKKEVNKLLGESQFSLAFKYLQKNKKHLDDKSYNLLKNDINLEKNKPLETTARSVLANCETLMSKRVSFDFKCYIGDPDLSEHGCCFNVLEAQGLRIIAPRKYYDYGDNYFYKKKLRVIGRVADGSSTSCYVKADTVYIKHY